MLAHEVEVGAKTGGHHKIIDEDVAAATGSTGANQQARAVLRQMRDAEFALDLNLARRDKRGKGSAELAAGGELVVGPSAESLCRIVAAQQPDRFGLRGLCRKAREIGQRADRGMSRAQHGDSFAGITRTVPSQYIRHSVSDLVDGLGLADRAQAIGASRIWRMPGTGGVDP